MGRSEVKPFPMKNDSPYLQRHKKVGCRRCDSVEVDYAMHRCAECGLARELQVAPKRVYKQFLHKRASTGNRRKRAHGRAKPGPNNRVKSSETLR